MYVLGLLIVAAIVNWLVDTVAAAIVTRYVVPSLQRARRERRSEITGPDYLRTVAAARFVRYVADAIAVSATCWYYAQNNTPAWPAWAVFGSFFVVFHLPRLARAAGDWSGVTRSRA